MFLIIILGLTILLPRACDFILQYMYRAWMILLDIFGNWNDENNSIYFSILHCHIDASLSSDLFDITKFNFPIAWKARRIDDLLQACREKIGKPPILNPIGTEVPWWHSQMYACSVLIELHISNLFFSSLICNLTYYPYSVVLDALYWMRDWDHNIFHVRNSYNWIDGGQLKY